MCGLSLHEEHSALFSLLEFFCEFFLLFLFIQLFLLLFFLIIKHGLSLGLLKPLFFHISLHFFLLPFFFLLFSERFPRSHYSVFLLVYSGLKLIFFLVILLPSSFLFLFAFSLDIVQLFPQLFKSHLLQQSNTDILDLLFGSGSDFLFELSNLLDKLFFLLHFNAFFFFFLFLNSFALFDFLVAHFFILFYYFLSFDGDVLLALLDLLNEVLFVFKHLVFNFLSLLSQFLGDQAHIVDEGFFLLHFFFIRFHSSLSCKFHLDLSSLLLLHGFIVIFFFHLFFPIFIFTFVSHVDFKVFHSLLFLLDFFIKFLLLPQDSCHV